MVLLGLQCRLSEGRSEMVKKGGRAKKQSEEVEWQRQPRAGNERPRHKASSKQQAPLLHQSLLNRDPPSSRTNAATNSTIRAERGEITVESRLPPDELIQPRLAA
jgi:hypothetical protein